MAPATPQGSRHARTRARTIGLAVEDWPAADRLAWASVVKPGDILDDAGPGAHWAAATRKNCAESYGVFLAFLIRTGRFDAERDIGERAAPEVVWAYANELLERCQPATAAVYLKDLYIVLRAMRPTTDWTWIRTLERRVAARGKSADLAPAPTVTASAVLAWSLACMNEADTHPDWSPLESALAYRGGLMLAMLVACPVRRRAFVAIELGRHLLETTDGFQLRFGTTDMKDRRAREFPFPPALVEPMRRYLAVHRPVLLQGKASAHLWITERGGGFADQSLGNEIKRVTTKAFGEPISPHRFRHIAATSIAVQDPAHVGIIRDVLGHATLRTAERHYNRARTLDALARYQADLEDLRDPAARPGRRTRH